MRHKFTECSSKLTELIQKHPEMREDLQRIQACVQECMHHESRQIEYLARENYELSQKVERLKSKAASPVPKLNFNANAPSDFHQEFMDRADEFSASWREAMKAGR